MGCYRCFHMVWILPEQTESSTDANTNGDRGLVATLQAVTQSWGGEMALRFLMGAAEAGYGPGIPFLLSFFYLRHEVGFRCGVFLSAAPLANTFAGALAYGITSGHPSIAKWRVLFLVEGLPTIVMAAVAYFYLPDSPEKAKFLDEDEKRVAMARSVRQAGSAERIGNVDWRDFLRGLMDVKAWFTGVREFLWRLAEVYADISYSSCISAAMSASPLFPSFCQRFSRKWDFLPWMLKD